MANKKLGIGSVEVNKKFKDQKEAHDYVRNLYQHIGYICKKKNWQASAMIVISNIMKDVSLLEYERTGKRGRPPKVLRINERMANDWYKGDYKTDWHLHILLVSKPSYALINNIYEYIKKNWFKVSNACEEDKIGVSELSKKKVYKKNCNIKIADYFINQSLEVRFCNFNYSGEEDLKYSLKEYYREYLKADSGKRRLYHQHHMKPMSEDKYLQKLNKIESKFDAIEKYFYDITEDKNKKEKTGYMKKIQLNKIAENHADKENINKVQNMSRKKNDDNNIFTGYEKGYW